MNHTNLANFPLYLVSAFKVKKGNRAIWPHTAVLVVFIPFATPSPTIPSPKMTTRMGPHRMTAECPVPIGGCIMTCVMKIVVIGCIRKITPLTAIIPPFLTS
jgi:hypothetical protein